MSGHPIDAVADTFPLSAQQAHLLSREQKIGRLLVGTVVLELPPECAAEDVRRALVELCARHEILRTQYVAIEGLKLPVQSIQPAPEFTLPESALNVIDSDTDPADLLAETRARLGAEGPLLAASILRAPASSSRLFLAAPLRSIDAASLAVLARDLRALLVAGEAACPLEEALQYADYAAWQNELLENELGERGRVFWRGLLDTHAASLLPLPFERDHATQGNIVRTGAWNDALPTKLAAAARALGASEDHLLFFLWTAFVTRLSGARQLLGGFAIDGRSDEVHETAGPFARLLPVAADLDPAKSLSANWQRFADSLAASLAWKDCLDERDLADSDGRLRLSHTFGYDTVALSNYRILKDDTETDRLHLEYRKEGGRAYLTLSHIEERFPPSMAAIWLDQFAAFLARALDALDTPIGETGMLGTAERRRVLEDFNTIAAPPTAYHGSLLHRLFEAQADAAPERIAVQIGDANLTYGELERRANRVANTLRELGLQPDRIVGIYAGRAIETVVAILGVLKAGGAYLPLDPEYPAARLAFMLDDARAAHLLTLGPLPPEVALDRAVTVHSLATTSPLWHAPEDRPATSVTAANLAYVIYTSGSTGQPKGVMISHANAAASTRARFAFYADPMRAFLLLSSFSFDSSVAGLFWALSQGGRLCLPEGEEHRDPARLAALIERAGISHFLALPSLHAQILGQLGNHRLACAIVAGEACPAELPRAHAARLPAVTLVNEYGPTEGSVWCTGWRADLTPDDESVAIGRPIRGARIHILDAALEPVPIGVEGEIYVAGAGVARGYSQRPALTAERFVPNPHGIAAGERLYRTGDLGRYRPDGVIEYRGRIDQQVKIRGFRIELGEIEAALRRCDGVEDAAVIARATPAGHELVGFVAAGDPQAGQPSLDDLRATLADMLPAYMLPVRLRRLEQLPHTPNGKLDRNALEALDARRREYVAPRNELEHVVAAVWADALAVERVGVHDNFFELGGHSLLATKLRSRLQAELNVALPLRFFFEGETLEQFAAKIAAYRAGELGDARIDALETLFAEAEAR